MSRTDRRPIFRFTMLDRAVQTIDVATDGITSPAARQSRTRLSPTRSRSLNLLVMAAMTISARDAMYAGELTTSADRTSCQPDP